MATGTKKWAMCPDRESKGIAMQVAVETGERDKEMDDAIVCPDRESKDDAVMLEDEVGEEDQEVGNETEILRPDREPKGNAMQVVLENGDVDENVGTENEMRPTVGFRVNIAREDLHEELLATDKGKDVAVRPTPVVLCRVLRGCWTFHTLQTADMTTCWLKVTLSKIPG